MILGDGYQIELLYSYWKIVDGSDYWRMIFWENSMIWVGDLSDKGFDKETCKQQRHLRDEGANNNLQTTILDFLDFL